MKCVVYVLRSSKDGRLYIGMTQNLERRLMEHKEGKVRSTRNRRPLDLIYSQECEDRTEAARQEKFLKSGAGHRKLRAILGSVKEA